MKKYTTEALKSNQHLLFNTGHSTLNEHHMFGYTDNKRDEKLDGWYSSRQIKSVKLTIRQRRIKFGGRYIASGSARGLNRRNVYLIDGKYYAYHPEYAKTDFHPLDGELKGYVRVNEITPSNFYQVGRDDNHKDAD